MPTLRPVLARRRSLATPGASPILMALVVLLAMMFDVPSAAAQRIRIGIGIGTGLSVLQGLSKPKSDRSYSRRRYSDDEGSSRRHKSKRQANRSRDDADEGTSKRRKAKQARPKSQEDDKTATGEQGNEPVAKSSDAAALPSAGSKSTERQIQPEGDPTETPSGNAAPPKTAALPSGKSYPPVDQAARGTPGSQPISTPAEIAATQERLRSLGYDVPSPSGRLDLRTKFAIMRFQGSLGATANGVLTVEQLQRLTAMVDQAGHK